MITTCVHVKVKEEFVNQFIAECKRNHLESVNEDGNLRFDVLQSPDDPCVFMLYEVYQTEGASAAHKHTPHYLAWRDAVAHMMQEPRRGVRYNMLFPEGEK